MQDRDKMTQERFIIIAPKDEQTIIVNDGEPHEQQSWALKYYSVDDFTECLDLLFEMVYQACAVHPYGVEDCLDSMALRTNVDAMKYLAKHGKLKITKEVGRRVFATVEG